MLLSLINDLKPGEAKPLAQYRNKRFLLNNGGSYKIGSNVCPHQASRIISAKTTNLVCQYHGWSWDHNGEPTGAGYTKLCNEKTLNMTDAFQHQGLIFDKNIDLPTLPISFESFELKEFRVDQLKVNEPKQIMNIFLDVDHIPLVHKGVYSANGIVGDPDVEWEYFENGSIQKVYHSNHPDRPLIFMWLAIYPFTMIEWQPGSLFITDCFSHGNGYSDVAVFKYQESFTNTYEKDQATWEIAWSQDKTQSEQMVSINPIMFEEQKFHYLEWTKKNGFSS